jgi:acetolactate synthase-1/2/3 large subunit
MIYKLEASQSDFNALKNRKNNLADNLDYNDSIVKKPWGYEYLVFENENVAIWMLHISRIQKTSMHSHPNKTTALILLGGDKAKISSIDKKYILKESDCLMIGKSAFHQTEAVSDISNIPMSQNGIWVMEIESPVDKSDLVRLKDNYGRVGNAYEGESNMVCSPVKHLRLDYAKSDYEKFDFFNQKLTMIQSNKNLLTIESENAYVFLIKHDNSNDENIGISMTLNESKHIFSDEKYKNSHFLMIVRKNMSMKLTDYIFDFLEKKGIQDIFAISGGGAMHLIDSIGKNEKLNYISAHHEQAAAMASEGYARIKGLPGICVVTSGPGGTNASTGVIGAWIDSIPMVVISGQVTSDTLSEGTELRQFGIQECNNTKYAQDYTKYAITVTDPKTIKYHLEKAYYLATTGRSGPVWLDIPLDVQSQTIDVDELDGFEIPQEKINTIDNISSIISGIQQAKRPVIIYGYGIRLSKTEEELLRFIETTEIPVISSWTASDIIPTESPLYIGRSGILGDRAGNFTTQNSDLIIILGSRMSIPQVGYNYKIFARKAKKIMVDIDIEEINKPSLSIDIKVNSDLKNFFNQFFEYLKINDVNFKKQQSWVQRCQTWKKKYPVVLPEYKDEKDFINSFYFIDYLSSKLTSNAIVVTDMGTSFTCTMQTFKTKKGQRLFTSSGHASMGFGLPGVIGACIASNRQKTIGINGEGGLQMNIQELQTIVTYQLPIVLFVINNDGYLTIKSMQQNHFGRLVGSDPSSNVECPNMGKIAKAYGLDFIRLSSHDELHEKLDFVLSLDEPIVCEIMMNPNQPLIPRVSSMKLPDGKVVSKPMEDLFPFLPRDEFEENMIIDSVEILNKE